MTRNSKRVDQLQN